MTEALAQTCFVVLFFSFAVGAIGSLILRNNDRLADWWGNSFAILGSISGIIASISALAFGNTFSYTLPSSFSILSFSINFDYLAAFFSLVLSLISLFASIFALGYVKHFFGKYNIGSLGFFYNTFIAGVMLVFLSSNAIFFLIAWELMALTSYALVVYERHDEKNVKAGLLYFIMTHIGTAFIILLFLLLFKQVGSFDFAAIKAGLAGMSPALRTAVFIFALIGFGMKAGIIPLHIWLPSAHPAAPSHVSAILSGVMIKTGIYMLIRLFLDIMPGTSLWWGLAVLVIGSVSSLLGVLYALAEHDIKRLLAYHSIENIGIILLGLGSSLTFLALGFKSLAILGLTASLYHTLNHATFKALLFLGAGSVVSKTHTRNIEEYGGLIRFMPLTALFFLIGSMAISALPPFNGFFSEWMTFQSLFRGFQALNSMAQWIFVLAAGSLAFTGGLAAACFVKAFGATFLARPRSEEARHAHESEPSLLVGMGGLAILTLVFGFFAGPISSVLAKTAGSLGALKMAEAPMAASWNSVRFADGFASLSMPLVLGVLALSLAIVAFIVYLWAGGRKVRTCATWDCGTTLDSRMEITATGFSRSIVTIFNGILKSTKQQDIEYHDADMRYFSKENRFTLETRDIYKDYLYEPLHRSVLKISNFFKRVQTGNINVYILYIFLAIFILLIALV